MSLLSAIAQRQLSFYRENDSDRIIRVVKTDSAGAGQPTSVERYIHLDRDAILPLYTIDSGSRASGYEVQVLYYEGEQPVTYNLRERADAFEFQRLTTGFRTVEYFGQVSCTVVVRGRFGILGRDSELGGQGELQFWRPPEPDRVLNTTDNLSPVSESSNSRRAGKGHSPRTSIVDAQSDFALANDGTEVVISTPPPKPILMAFSQDHEKRTMLMIDSEYSLRLSP